MNNTLGENWKQELNQAAEHPLDKKSLENLAEALKNVPIFLTGDANLVGATADVDAKLFWTLTSDQFQPRFVTVPDLTRSRMLVYISSLNTIKSNLVVYLSKEIDPLVRGNACLGLLGCAAKAIHEIVHGAHWKVSLLESNRWILLNDDWGLPLDEMKNGAATLEKLFGYRYGAKVDSEFPVDAGRLWEHSLTEGDAVIQGALLLVAVTIPEQGDGVGQEVLLSESPSEQEALDITEDPSLLLQVMRARAMNLRARCHKGFKVATSPAAGIRSGNPEKCFSGPVRIV